jgi:ketosteroid isomerase-like protein
MLKQVLVASSICFVVLLAFDGVAIAKAPFDANASSNEHVAEQWFSEVIDKENVAKADELLLDDAVLELAPSYKSNISKTNRVVGKQEIKKHMKDFVDLTSSVKSEDVDVLAEGNKVAMYRLITTKYNDGTTVKTPWAIFFTFKNGKIASIKHVHDTLLEHQQRQQQTKQK